MRLKLFSLFANIFSKRHLLPATKVCKCSTALEKLKQPKLHFQQFIWKTTTKYVCSLTSLLSDGKHEKVEKG